MTNSIKRGMRVRAFDPATVGVIRFGTVVKVGSKFVHVDFGNGTRKVAPLHVVEVLPDFTNEGT